MASEGKRKKIGLKKSADYYVFITVLILVAFGVVMVFSSSYYVAMERNNDAYFYVKKQLIGMAGGLAAMIFTMNFDYHKYAKLKWIIMILSVGLLAAVWIPGVGVNLNGAQRWLALPIVGSFQPSEFAKLGMVMFLASELALRPKCLTSFKGFLYAILMASVFIVLVVAQKSLSVTMVMGLTMIAMLFIAGAKASYVGITLGGVGAVGAVSIFAASDGFRLDRIYAFLDPWSDPSDTGYQLIQSLYSLGSGGLFGLGLGHSRQKYLFLPYSESDFIFAVIAEELGFIGALVVLGVFAFLIFRCIKIAVTAPDLLGTLMAAGITTILAIQVIFHILVVTGGMPPTGMPLPFISAGSSSLVIFMAEMGIILNISRYARLKT